MVEGRDKVHRSALSAWQGLVEDGGLEPDGRDFELADGIRQTLDADSETVEKALAAAPMGAFLEALFRAIEPFPMMFGDILRFFESAGAREGQRQWRLVIGEDAFDLEHFVGVRARVAVVGVRVRCPGSEQSRGVSAEYSSKRPRGGVPSGYRFELARADDGAHGRGHVARCVRRRRVRPVPGKPAARKASVGSR